MIEKRTHELLGTVVSDKNDKTITVLVQTYKTDSLYGKRVKYSKKFAAHDEKNEAKIGDKVRIVETRPLSKMKHYRLIEIVEKAIIL
ncbi:MAG: 30S ribosomal protein S17 [Bacilli bacterium]